MLAIAAIMTTMPVVTNVNTDAIKVEAQSHGIDASSVYETKSVDLGNNIKNLVILIPNEGHESQSIGDQSTDQRLVNQPYIPQSVTVPVGTGKVHGAIIEIPEGFESSRMDQASMKKLVANDGNLNFRYEGTYGSFSENTWKG